ncbi:unnamed protein product [Cylindrotheca closterium]|uniref:Uncharacterized protein n=1 Tax=Cylindrotheca closterium TaxID=2856 RepID=A0AAD2CFG6_9STRA|nr:unnamed protein product [Cylindrotheca closterium]
MKRFRRSGLADDDEIGASAVTLRSRPSDDSSIVKNEQEYESACEEESVVSAMTSASDLESIYNETATKFRPLNRRERFLLQQSVPEHSRTVSTILSEQERTDRQTLSATVANQLEDDSGYVDLATSNPWLQPRPYQPWQMEYPGKTLLDPHEKLTGNLRKKFAIWYDREDVPLGRILERGESTQSSYEEGQ